MLQRPSVEIRPKRLPAAPAGDKQPRTGGWSRGWAGLGWGRSWGRGGIQGQDTPGIAAQPFLGSAGPRCPSPGAAAAARRSGRGHRDCSGRHRRAASGVRPGQPGTERLPGTEGDNSCCSSTSQSGFHSNRCLGLKESGRVAVPSSALQNPPL